MRRRRFAPPPLLATAAVAVALVALAFTWRRLFLGIDLNDEGFYVAVPYRFALGARPFVDEMNILQTAEFFVFPFVKLYVWVTGGANGLVLFTRHLYLAWVTIVSLLACLGLKKLVRWEHALVACLVCATFVFVSTTNLSYNTLGAGLLVIGMALGARAVVSRGRDRWLVAAGVAQALAALAYPTLVLALPVTAACLACSTPGRRRRALRAWALGAGATLVAEALLLASFGVGNVLRCLHYQLTGWHTVNGASGAAKLWDVAAGVTRHVELFPLVVVAALAVWLAYRRWPAARLALVLTPLALLPFGEQLVSGADGFGVIYGLAAPYFYLFVPIERRALATRLLVWGYLPALAAGLVSGYSSANGWLQMDVGLLPAMVLSGVFLALALAPRAGESERLRRVLPGVTLACLAGILAVTVVYQFQFLPRAVPYSQMTVTLQQRPLRRHPHHSAARRLPRAAARRPCARGDAVGPAAVLLPGPRVLPVLAAPDRRELGVDRQHQGTHRYGRSRAAAAGHPGVLRARAHAARRGRAGREHSRPQRSGARAALLWRARLPARPGAATVCRLPPAGRRDFAGRRVAVGALDGAQGRRRSETCAWRRAARAPPRRTSEPENFCRTPVSP